MKRIFLWVGFFALLPFAAAQRLPELAVPENYKLSFAPDFQKDNFEGEETISVRVLKTTSEIVLNSAEIEFHEATITSAGTTQRAKVTLDNKREVATLAFAQPIEPGAAQVHIKYSGILNDELRGLYLGRDRDGSKYAVTQFEATDARRAFPSFDEPSYKATFDVSVVADNGMVAISNGKVFSDTPGPGTAKHTVTFATTAKIEVARIGSDPIANSTGTDNPAPNIAAAPNSTKNPAAPRSTLFRNTPRSLTGATWPLASRASSLLAPK